MASTDYLPSNWTETQGAIDLLHTLGAHSLSLAVQFIDGNSERSLSTTYGRDAGVQLATIGSDRLRVKADEGSLEVLMFDGTLYFNFYL